MVFKCCQLPFGKYEVSNKLKGCPRNRRLSGLFPLYAYMAIIHPFMAKLDNKCPVFSVDKFYTIAVSSDMRIALSDYT